MAFGHVMIDRLGPVRATPAVSTISGLLANAMGYFRWEADRLARLQERLVIGCRLDRRGEPLTDFQTAQLRKNDVGWTTRGCVEGRDGGPDTYKSPHIRERDYHAGGCVTVALRLLDEADRPTLADIASALNEPRRPLFLGRKCCLPADRLMIGFVEASTVYDALLLAPVGATTAGMATGRRARLDERMLCVLPGDEPCPPGFQMVRASERRDWPAGVHAGETTTFHGEIPRELLTPTLDA